MTDLEQEEGGEAGWIARLSEELRAKQYQAQAVRRVYIPKADGRKRPLGIPTVKDRVVQTALWLVLMPIYEADFHEDSYGFRPKRNAQQAMGAIKEALYRGMTEVIDADVSSYFERIEHRRRLRLVARRVADGSVLKLIKAWLRAPIEEQGEDGKRRRLGNKRGTPQGGVISPLLANIYLDDLDHGVNERTGGKARMVRYADDFVILCAPGQSAAIKQRLEGWLARRGLELNEAKTRSLNARTGTFEFLGWAITPRKTKAGSSYYHMEPSGKSRGKLLGRVKGLLNRQTFWRAEAEVVEELNLVLRGWSRYYLFGHWKSVFNHMHDLVSQRLRTWLWKKHRQSRPRYGYYTRVRLREQYGLYPMNLNSTFVKSSPR